MRLNPECTRSILLELEDKLTWDQQVIRLNSPNGLKTYESYKYFGHKQFIYTVSKLLESSILIGQVIPADDSIYDIEVNSITWEGHKFIDNIRDPKVWKTTKKITGKFASVSINLISSISSQVITKIIEDTMKLP